MGKNYGTLSLLLLLIAKRTTTSTEDETNGATKRHCAHKNQKNNQKRKAQATTQRNGSRSGSDPVLGWRQRLSISHPKHPAQKPNNRTPAIVIDSSLHLTRLIARCHQSLSDQPPTQRSDPRNPIKPSRANYEAHREVEQSPVGNTDKKNRERGNGNGPTDDRQGRNLPKQQNLKQQQSELRERRTAARDASDDRIGDTTRTRSLKRANRSRRQEDPKARRGKDRNRHYKSSNEKRKRRGNEKCPNTPR